MARAVPRSFRAVLGLLKAGVRLSFQSPAGRRQAGGLHPVRPHEPEDVWFQDRCPEPLAGGWLFGIAVRSVVSDADGKRERLALCLKVSECEAFARPGLASGSNAMGIQALDAGYVL